MVKTSEPIGDGEAGAGPCPSGGEHERDERGGCTKCHRFLAKNTKALVVGDRSAAFWRAAAAERTAIVASVVADAGHTVEDAPRALLVAADALAQAILIQQSAFVRLVESGGPLTSANRTRRALIVWQGAVDRTEKFLRLVGLRRVPKPAEDLAAYVRRVHGQSSPQDTRPAPIDTGAEGEGVRARSGNVAAPAGRFTGEGGER